MPCPIKTAVILIRVAAVLVCILFRSIGRMEQEERKEQDYLPGARQEGAADFVVVGHTASVFSREPLFEKRIEKRMTY